jgi:hypothetical protein
VPLESRLARSARGHIPKDQADLARTIVAALA